MTPKPEWMVFDGYGGSANRIAAKKIAADNVSDEWIGLVMSRFFDGQEKDKEQALDLQVIDDYRKVNVGK
jgi:hypothetical protein